MRSRTRARLVGPRGALSKPLAVRLSVADRAMVERAARAEMATASAWARRLLVRAAAAAMNTRPAPPVQATGRRP